jgi:tRNA-dihydrouridine synthase A
LKYKANRFSIAPMMEWTDRHCRFFHRLLTRRALIYTEMITTGAVLHGDRARLMGYDAAEHPVALQLGGSDPRALADCARIAADMSYDEINLNVGCPSDRVQEGRFGACLMTEPALVGDCVAAMKARVNVPVTVKCRIGIDDQDPEERSMSSPAQWRRPASMRSSCMPARLGCRGCRRAKTATSRRSITIGSIG